MYTRVKTDAEISAMRESGRMLATVLELLVAAVEPDITTKDLALLASRELKALGGKPTFLGYEGFSDVLCVSINEEVVHGIPGDRLILTGDIVSVDFGVTYRGMITDAARSVIVTAGGAIGPKGVKGLPVNEQPVHPQDQPQADAADIKLLDTTLESLDAGIFTARGGCRVGDIAAAIQAVIERKGYGIVKDLVGHGVGHQLHEDPNIPNYGQAGKGQVLESGMTIAIEPMVTRGTWRVRLERDGWTVTTADRMRAAHFEDTILLTDEGAEILTR